MNQRVRMTRRVGFSSGHRYWLDSLTDKENRDLFGSWASKFNHGHNYFLEVTVEGVPSPLDGMILNIKQLDEWLQSLVVREFDQKSLNDEVPDFKSRPPTLENILLCIENRLGPVRNRVDFVKLKLEESPTLWAELDLDGERMITLTRTYEFAASHRLHSPQMTDEENQEAYGKCWNPAGHGHNYILEVSVRGEPDPKTGMIVELDALDHVVENEVVDRYDHKNLNSDLPEFAGKIPTTEIVVQEIWERLQHSLPADLVKVRLWETARNAFEVVRVGSD